MGLTLHALETHAFQGDEVDARQFRESIHQFDESLSAEGDPDNILVIAGSIASTIKEYGERGTRCFRAQSAEYQHIVSMLTDTIATLSQGTDRSVKGLREIEKQIERASLIEDVRAVREKLSHCLEALQEEIRGQQMLTATTTKELEQTVADSQARLASGPQGLALDQVTGLPGRSAAQAAIVEAIQQGKDRFAVIFVASRLQGINTRFGYAVGDRVLRKMCAHFRAGLSPHDKLFRWRGPGLLAILTRSQSVEGVRREIARLASVQNEDLVEMNGRSVSLSMSANWTVYPVGPSARALIVSIDQFIAAQSSD
jgi:GGDEF domain-containing protein